VDDAERLALGLVDAERKRRARASGAEVLEIDGLVLALSNVADPALNSVVVEREPADALGALRAAEEEFERRGHLLGVDLQVGRHPSIDEAVRQLRLTRIIEQPGMAVDLSALASAPMPEGVEICTVTGEREARALVNVGVSAFGDDPDVAGRFYAAGSFGVSGAWSFVAWEADRPVGIGASYLHEGAVGIFGVGVVPTARRRGLGAAITAHAARAHPGADLAWLQPTDMAIGMYRGIGFRRVSDWEVWVRDANP
jgi:ribosomal protein S18 acetylase RimI-like enzyme